MHGVGDAGWVERVLAEDPTVALSPELAAVLPFLKALTLEPWSLQPADLEPLRAAGLSDQAIEEAIAVCACFSAVDRLADAFDFPMSTASQKQLNVTLLTKLGYAAGVIPGGG